MAIEVTYSVDASEEEIQKRLFILGQLIAQEMRKVALAMGLFETGDYAQGFLATIKNGKLIIENRTDHAEPLEFGTYSYFEQYKGRFPDPAHPKKKDLPDDLAKRFPKGMQPFAPMRRVLYNTELMKSLIAKAFRS